MQEEKPIMLTHFSHQIPMPEGGSITPYKSHHTSSKNKKTKHKFDQFAYYTIEEKAEGKEEAVKKIIKILFKDDNQIFNQSEYPFTDPYDKMMTAQELSYLHPKKIVKN